MTFKREFIPEGMLAHAGVFSLDMTEFYLTVSDKEFSKFTVLVSIFENGQWSAPKKAFFNTEFNEHGVHFSPDGNWLFFSSTRPTYVKGIADTWHIWRCRKTRLGWSNPVFINIPGMENSLVSHPTITNSGKMYFHAANPDYSNMGIYEAQITARTVTTAKKINLSFGFNRYACTPYISPDNSYLLFAEIGEEEELFIAYKSDSTSWSIPIKLNAEINTGNLGNPFISTDQSFLFFAAKEKIESEENWVIRWVEMPKIDPVN